ncbi:hypothetical protein OAE73_00645 [bacterium]|nr:hypothetical protein [bacterium]
MAANDYIRTVNITPLGTSYSWDTPPDWITISRVGTTDEWTITVAPNNGPERDAILTVRHANSTTVDTINVNQSAGAGLPDPTATPVPAPTATPVPAPTATAVSSSSGSGGGAGPTATPVPAPTATPVPPTAVPACTSTGSSIALSNFVFNKNTSEITGDIAITMDTWSSNSTVHVDVMGTGGGGFDNDGSAVLVSPASSQLGPGKTITGSFAIQDDAWGYGDTVTIKGTLFLCSNPQAVVEEAFAIQLEFVEPTATPVPAPTATAVSSSSGSGGGAGPTATPLPNLSVAINNNGVNVSSVTLDDFNNGPGSSVTKSFSYTNTATTTNQVPTIISKDSRYNVQFVYGTSVAGNVVGSCIITSLNGGAKFPISIILDPLVIAHPDNSNIRYTLGVTLSQGTLVVIEPTATPVSSGSGSGAGPIAAGFLEDAYTDQPISEYSINVGQGFNLYMHSNVAWRLEFSNSNLYNDGDSSGPPYTDAYDHELGTFDGIKAGTTLINLVNDANGAVLDTVTVTISPTPLPTSVSSGSGGGAGAAATPVPYPTATTYVSTGGGGGYGGGCHIAGELITMANGSKKPVEDLKVGDVLLSLDINGLSDDETTHHNFNISVSDYSDTYVPTVIKSIKVDSYHKYHNINDGLLKITQEHPILIRTTDNRIMFKRAEHVSIGDHMLNESEEWIVVNSNELIETEPFTTWTLDVEEKDVYFANGISVHNAVAELKADDEDAPNEL